MIIVGKGSSEYAPKATKHRPNKRIRRSEVPSPAYVLWEVRPKFEKWNDYPIGMWPPIHRGEPMNFITLQTVLAKEKLLMKWPRRRLNPKIQLRSQVR